MSKKPPKDNANILERDSDFVIKHGLSDKGG